MHNQPVLEEFNFNHLKTLNLWKGKESSLHLFRSYLISPSSIFQFSLYSSHNYFDILLCFIWCKVFLLSFLIAHCYSKYIWLFIDFCLMNLLNLFFNFSGYFCIFLQFSWVTQSCLAFVTPWTAACQASLSITNSWSLLKLVSIELLMPSNHLIKAVIFSQRLAAGVELYRIPLFCIIRIFSAIWFNYVYTYLIKKFKVNFSL